MLPFRYVAVFALLALATAQEFEYEARPAPARIQPGFSGQVNAKPTPVPILKQINRHNEDGSYTYGYEGADGSFKIETKDPNGEVKGKYGYVDDTGKVRVVEYGATKYGFQPAGEGITVAPPTIVDETTDKNGNQIQYEEYDQPQQQPARPRAPAPQRYEPVPQYQPQQFAPVTSRSSAVPQRAQISGAAPVSNFGFSAQPVRSFAPQPQPQRPSPSFSFSNAPAPIEEDNYEEPQPRPLPKITYAQPRPQPQQQQQQQQQQFGFAPANTQAISRPLPQAQPQYAPQPRPAARPAAGRGGVLDQLAKDYALPAGGAAPLHDISFGYY